MKKIAVIGAGLSGLVCASYLKNHNLDMDVFEKARGPGGRISTKRVDTLRYDHGAPGFSIKNQDVQVIFHKLKLDHHVEQWNGQVTGTPAMNAIAKALADDLPVFRSTRIIKIKDHYLYTEDGKNHGPYSRIILSIPAPQIPDIYPPARDMAEKTAFNPCRSLLLTFKNKPDDHVFHQDFVESVIAQKSKPRRGSEHSYVIHSTPQWAKAHIDLPNDEAKDVMLAAMTIDSDHLIHVQAHGWRFANACKTFGASFMEVDDLVSCCGDWCPPIDLGCGIERAIISGARLGEYLAQSVEG